MFLLRNKENINAGPAEPGSALFVIQYVNLFQQPGSSNLIGWKLEVGGASEFIQHGKG